MKLHDLVRSLHTDNGSKIVLVVADGLGGLPMEPGGPTELEAAATPNLDALAAANVCGLSIPVLPGITPGSGPGHLALFGYDPLEFLIGRGLLEALGVDLEVGAGDVAIRGNFCTVNERGEITDRRAGRIPTETCARLVDKLRRIRIDGVEIILRPVREYRFAMILRGEGLEDGVEDTDPQVTGVPPLAPRARNAASEPTAAIAAEFIRQAAELLREESPANMLTLRGFARRPPMPSFAELYGLRALAIAVYPMYRGLARLVGMTVLSEVSTLAEQVAALGAHWANYDFFFLHFKYTDSTGEDGKFDQKVKRIEELDAVIPKIIELGPDVLIVTGDHSTPCAWRSHSWHPVPVLLVSRLARPDRAQRFAESECLLGGLGQFEAKYLMSLALAHAGRLQKFGA
jgi:2,3-bisphosphoglycerate-independent phosphoglycerate mutase